MVGAASDAAIMGASSSQAWSFALLACFIFVNDGEPAQPESSISTSTAHTVILNLFIMINTSVVSLCGD